MWLFVVSNKEKKKRWGQAAKNGTIPLKSGRVVALDMDD